MNVIIAYLETMFSAYPQTPRLLEAKAELQAMMEDAYTGLIAQGASQNEAVGTVITDFGNLEELASVLGISAEIAPAPVDATSGGSERPGSDQPAASTRSPGRSQHPPVTMEEAEGFAEAQHRTRFRLSTALALLVVSAIPLIVLPAAADSRALPIDAHIALTIGIVLLLLIAAAGALLIVGISRAFAPFARLTSRRFTRNPVVTQWADELARTNERRRIVTLQVVVVLWILSPTPLILIATLMQHSPDQGFWIVVGTAFILLVVAAGLLVLLPTTWAHTVAETLNRASSRPAADGDLDDA